MATRKVAGPLSLIGWNHLAGPRRCEAKLKDNGGAVTYIEINCLLHAHEYMARLPVGDRDLVQAMAANMGAA